MRFRSYLNAAITILQSYQGTEPFHNYLKKYFSANKKYGSNDRKQISSLCYNYFRLGKAGSSLDTEEKILFGIFLCENNSSALLQFFKPEWAELINKSLEEKLAVSASQLAIEDIFPFNNELSTGIDKYKFNQSFLIQPKLFLRIRPGHKNSVIKKLEAAELQFELLLENCIALPNSSKIDSIIELDKEAVVQDYNSQRVGEFISAVRPGPSDLVWDCCAGSGGKSIMAYDINPDIQLTVSDKRESILQNLYKRFTKAGIRKYNAFVADISNGQVAFSAPTGPYDLIICDAPCSGSGTWSRTSEQLHYFKYSQLQKYSDLQKQIVKNVIPALKPGGHLLYITCSVFKKENEEVVEFINENSSLKLQKMELLKGYEMLADTLFAALFIVP